MDIHQAIMMGTLTGVAGLLLGTFTMATRGFGKLSLPIGLLVLVGADIEMFSMMALIVTNP